MKILVIGPSWVGDMMMSQSLYRTLKARYPDASIDVMAPEWCRPLLNRMPEVNQAIAMPLGHGALAVGERFKLGRALSNERYDRAYVLPNSLKSALIPFFARIPHRTGWRGEMRYGLLNDIRKLNKTDWPLMVERYVALAYDNGALHRASELPRPLLWPELRVDAGDIAQARSSFRLTNERDIIGFCPGAEFGPAKRWPHYHYAALAARLINEGYQVAIFGSAKDADTGQQITATLTAEQQHWCHNLAGATQLDQAVLLIAACKGVVTNDSGLMHVAAATGRPIVALYGPSSPDFTPPLSHQARIVRLIDGYHKVRSGEGEQGYHQSLIDIQPERVYTELQALLKPEDFS